VKAITATKARDTEEPQAAAPRAGSRLIPAVCLAAGAVSLVTVAVAWANGGHPPTWLLAVAFTAAALAGLSVAADVLTGKETPR
jgi:uncharacterized membrane protein